MNYEVKYCTCDRSTITFDGGFSLSGDKTTCAAVSTRLGGKSSIAEDTVTTATSPCRRNDRYGPLVEAVSSELSLIPHSHMELGMEHSVQSKSQSDMIQAQDRADRRRRQ